MRILCIDFDGVLHSYKSGWQGQTVINDPPTPGAMQFLVDATKEFRVMVFSSRSTNHKGIDAMQRWVAQYLHADLNLPVSDANEFVYSTLEWPTEKPPAFVTLDDRALTFKGEWPTLETIHNFKTWVEVNKDAQPTA